MTGALEQLLAIRVRRHHRAVTGQGQTQRLGQAVHGVGSEHARAGTAGGASRSLDLGHLFVGVVLVGRDDHGVHQVQLLELDDVGRGVGQLGLARFHGAARDKDHRNVQAHGGHQHAGGDLVAVGDAHQRVGAVGIDHVFDRVGDQVAAGQRIQHAVVAHGNAVVHRDGVEFLGHTARRLDLVRDQLTHVLQVYVAGHELGEGVGNGDDGLVKVAIFHASGTPQGARTGHVAAAGGGFGTVCGHGVC